MPVFLKKTKKIIPSTIHLPASKSESNRALVINALAGGESLIENLSQARDTQTLVKLLASGEKVLDVLDAGTTMRFLTAYCSIKNLNKILTGTPRMQERPIGILVDALRLIGANIIYLEKDGYPPIELVEFKNQSEAHIIMPGNVSSQFISALLMIAPVLNEGLEIELTGKIGSRPYIEMTLEIMAQYGLKYKWVDKTISVPFQKYRSRPFKVSPDWSAASYWYSIVALAKEGELHLPGLSNNSFQGDKVIADIMEMMGVETRYESQGVTLLKKDHIKEFSWDFSNSPDLAQTVAVTAAVKGITVNMSGLESLRIKETDRIAALQKELGKINADLVQLNENEWVLIPAKNSRLPESCNFKSYDDHRMVMAFAPVAMVTNVNVDSHLAVNKSYPGFWKDLAVAGVDVTIIA